MDSVGLRIQLAGLFSKTTYTRLQPLGKKMLRIGQRSIATTSRLLRGYVKGIGVDHAKLSTLRLRGSCNGVQFPSFTLVLTV